MNKINIGSEELELKSDTVNLIGTVYYILIMFTWIKMEAGWFAVILTLLSMAISIYLAGVVNF